MISKDKILVIIPARGGSKGILGKNFKKLGGKPLIEYTIDLARQLFDDSAICISTDDLQIIQIAEHLGLKVPFIRPTELATDTSNTYDALLHAINFYEQKDFYYDVVLLLQPTSPFRLPKHIEEALALYSPDIDMVVSVKESHAASVLCNENTNGYLNFVLNTKGIRRQEMTTYYEYNGSIYVINIQSLKEKDISKFNKKIKYVMSAEYSIDIDTPFDWNFAEYILKTKTHV
ncbi:MAG: acylneuraminate cytidylyltransferase family protein [Massilibacteroides sp.]|nr:acylneuraminate cytidylyltransferase family protein [Massilibacteroides sp.]MDD3062269.1 acylneuraminate cytidylyltransferase family protein [Massilibacteroides sp.]MDD4113992.1 acylneuraminate cytidylyltransferase family protein [Massilibacteroides sp.]MDD4660042.1 acylneuraminate cytidylyltransferase family protein [Massilibacteroides sp.]